MTAARWGVAAQPLRNGHHAWVPPIVLSRTVDVRLDDQQLRERVLEWFASAPHKVAEDDAGRIVIETGSELKMRLLGGFFIASSSLPTRTEITTERANANIQVTIAAATRSFGLKTGMRGRYEGRLSEIVSGVASALMAEG